MKQEKNLKLTGLSDFTLPSDHVAILFREEARSHGGHGLACGTSANGLPFPRLFWCLERNHGVGLELSNKINDILDLTSFLQSHRVPCMHDLPEDLRVAGYWF